MKIYTFSAYSIKTQIPANTGKYINSQLPISYSHKKAKWLMVSLILLFLMLGFLGRSWAQTTIALLNFDASGSTMTYAASSTSGTFGIKTGISDNSGGTRDQLPGVTFYNSADNGYWVNNGGATITCANVTGLGSYCTKKVSLRLSAFSMQSNNNGPDNGDNVIVGVSLDGGTNYSNEIDVNGGATGNVWWHYSTGIGLASRTYVGNNTPTSFAPTTAGVQTTNGYSTIEINIPDNATQVRVRIILDNNSNNEAWVIDDIKITGNPLPSVTAAASPTTVCSGSNVTLTTSATPVAPPTTLLSEDFNAGTNSWTKTNNSTGGTPANAAWTLKPNNTVVCQNCSSTQTLSSNDATQFYLSNSDAQGSGGTTATLLQSPVMSTVGYSSLSLVFYQYYRDWDNSDAAKVQVSTNGTNWTDVATYTTTQGSAGSFLQTTISLNGYVNNSTFYFRFKYDAVYSYYWAIDNVTLTGTPINYTYNYSWAGSPSGTAGLPSGAGTPSAANASIVANPTLTTNYTATATNTTTGCSASAAVVAVTVNPLPTGTLSNTGPICAGGSANIIFTKSAGTGPFDLVINGTPYSNIATGSVVTSVTPGANTTYTLTLITDKGVTPNCGNTVSTSTVVVVAADPSAPTATRSPDVATVCAGQSLTLTDVTDNGGGIGTCNIEYSHNGGAWSTTLTPFAATTGTNTIAIRKNCNASGCDNSSVNTYSWTVVADPAAPTATKSPNIASVCAGTSLTLTGATQGSGGTGSCTIEYAISTDGGASYSAFSATVPNFTATGTDNRIKIRTNCNGSGCDFSPETVYSWVVNALPTFSYTSTNINCNSVNDGTITITASGGSPAYTYSLLAGDNFSYSGASPKTISGLAPNIQYTIRVKDSNGCIQINNN